MIDFVKELNAEQLKVVQNGDGPCLVLAGAGSGKTRAITYRVAYLLEKGVDPNNILLVTFTNKAATEMIDRVQALTNGEICLPWSGTYHHIAYRILKQDASFLGYKNNFSVLDSQDSLEIFKLCLKQEGIDRKEKRFPSAKVIQAIASYARNAEMSLEEVLKMKYPDWLDITDKISRIVNNYADRKRTANVMDFDDLLINLYLLLLKSDQVREKFSRQFQYILVDEYQDTNKIQASIIKLLAMCHRNILAVGDDAQSIYSFRAADIKNILNFEKEYADAKIFKLETNYRSTPDILDVANTVIANNINQYEKDLKSILNNFTKPEIRAFADSREEADFVADRISELYDEGVPLHKLAVLFRAAFHSQALEVELTKRGIDYDYRGGIRFFERAHIKGVLAYLRIFNNVEDAAAWQRVLGMQVGIGPASASKIIEIIRAENIENVSENLSAKARLGWNDFMQTWQLMNKEAIKNPSALIQAVIQSKYSDYLENEYPDYRERLQDLNQLAVFAEQQTDLDKFLAEATLQESFSSVKNENKQKNKEKLVLSTIHQAKGLEWEGVFVINMCAGQFPSDRANREDNGLEEERRLFYVAITRAQKYLYFTYPLVGGFNGYMQGPVRHASLQGVAGGPSTFLDEIDKALVDEHNPFNNTSVFNKTEPDEITYQSEDEPFSSKQSKPRTSFLADISDL